MAIFSATRAQMLEQLSLRSTAVPAWLEEQRAELLKLCQLRPQHGSTQKWLTHLEFFMRAMGEAELVATNRAIQINPIQSTNASGLDTFGKALTDQLQPILAEFKPWRIGPWQFADLCIESEWDCSFKFERLAAFGPSLRDQSILEVGAANGYYSWRLLGAGAHYVLGIDPAWLCWHQFALSKCLQPASPIDMLPLTFEQLKPSKLQFDLALSMGVLYHRRSPLDHLQALWQSLRPGGKVVVETLVVDLPGNAQLCPDKRYAGMGNVFPLPSPALLSQWLTQVGFIDIQILGLSLTRAAEQRQTSWINTFSLEHFLTEDRLHTLEGLPAPWRMMIQGQRPDS